MKYVLVWLVLVAVLTVVAGENLIKNGDFRQGQNGWLFWKDKSSQSSILVEAYAGGTEAFVATISSAQKTGVLLQKVPIKGGTRYRVSVWAKVDEPAGTPQVSFRWLNDKGKFVDVYPKRSIDKDLRVLHGEWGRDEFEVVSPKDASLAFFMLSVKGVDVHASFRDVSMVECD